MMKYHYFFYFFREIILQKTIREGLLLALPFLIIGSIALTIRSIPNQAYQFFIQTILDGQIYSILNALHLYTLMIIPLILIFTMSFSFGRAICHDTKEILFYPVVTFCAYLIFLSPQRSLSFLETFGSMQTFIAMIVTISSCSIFYFFQHWKFTNLQHYIKMPNLTFNIVYRTILPAIAVFLFFALANRCFDPNIQDIAANLHMQLFSYLGNNLFSAAIYLLIEQCYWFVGIHGSNVLDVVATNIFNPRIIENSALLAAGLQPSEIYTKAFFDLFVSIGGCGSALSLIISIFFFSKLPHTRRIAKIALLPCLFNISEIVIIGLPVICNGFFLIPFLLVPLVFLLCGSIAMHIGLVPVTVHAVEWTSPVILSGYLSTDSIAGSLLQIFVVSLGVFIYRPFIRRYEINESKKLKASLKGLVAEVISCEKIGKSPALLTNIQFEDIAKVLSADLQQALANKELRLFYQPQVNYDGTIYGGEALLRWRHPQLGYIYPPLIIALAEENRCLDELGLYLIDQSCRDLAYLTQTLSDPIKISVNVSPPQLYNQSFCDQVHTLLNKYDFGSSIIAFELTEQIALCSTLDIKDRLRELKDMGILLSMDDFGMGHSSVMYLQDSEFDIVKLDGNLTKKVLSSERSVDIIEAIMQLSTKFDFKVVAEYVETAEQRDKLANIGCEIYQGWLYSPAVPLREFVEFVQSTKKSTLSNIPDRWASTTP